SLVWHPVFLSPLFSPLRLELFEILFELLLRVYAQPGERPAAEVMDKDIQSDQELVSRLACAHAEIIVLKEADAELFVKAADLFEQFGAKQQTKSAEPLYF